MEHCSLVGHMEFPAESSEVNNYSYFFFSFFFFLIQVLLFLLK